MTSTLYRTQLAVFIRQNDATAMRDYLTTLRNANFRMASTVLAEGKLWAGVADFWHFAALLVATDNRAYLGTMLKAATASGHLQPTEEFVAACTTDIDRKKVLEALIPMGRQPEDIAALLKLFACESPNVAEGVLFRVGTAPAYFVLFNMLKQHEDQPDYLRRFGIELIRKGDKAAFNLACIIKEYFALPELPGTFSLSLPPYELSRLDTSYDSFKRILQR